jgi:hypothetical protein
MDLPLRILGARAPERWISVDGAWGQPGLNLSHWPGNTTPKELRHDLSTGVALKFARLPEAERARLAEGCIGIANNHFDTDGCCAMFAVRRPERALEREAKLLEAAAAGDFFQTPSEHAFRLDAVITNLADPARSPWADRSRGLDDAAKHTLLATEIVERMPELLDGDLAEFAALWRPESEDLAEDRAALAAAAKDEIVHLDHCVWEGPAGLAFDPGRHALFGGTKADRILAIGHPADGGTTYRLLLSTLSWFDLVTRTALPRPDLAALAARLNEAEGTLAGAETAWRFQEIESPSPELWFGDAELEFFSERCPALRPSRLDTASVRRAIAESLRASWRFPEDDVP